MELLIKLYNNLFDCHNNIVERLHGNCIHHQQQHQKQYYFNNLNSKRPHQQQQLDLVISQQEQFNTASIKQLLLNAKHISFKQNHLLIL